MAIDTSIYQLAGRGVRSVQDYDRMAAEADAAQQQQKMGALQLLMGQQKADEYTRGVQRADSLRRLAGTWGAQTTDEQRIASLRNQGFASEADALEGTIMKRREVGAKAGKEDAEAAAKKYEVEAARRKEAIQHIGALSTPEDAIASLNAAADIPPQARASLLQSLQATGGDPVKFREWQARTVLSLASAQQQAEAMMPKMTSAGGALVNTNPLAGPTGQDAPSAIPITQSADNAATQVTTKRGQDVAADTAAAARTQAEAHFNAPQLVPIPSVGAVLFDRKSGGTQVVTGPDGKPLVDAKPMNDAQSKANLFGTRAQEADRIVQGLAQQGVTSPSIPQQLTSGEGKMGAIATAMAKPEQQQLDQAQRDFINAVLRRESGAVISEGEFTNARKQYFVQPGDSPQVIAQKTRNRQIAVAGILAEVPEGRRGVDLGGSATIIEKPKPGAKPAAAVPGGPTVSNW